MPSIFNLDKDQKINSIQATQVRLLKQNSGRFQLGPYPHISEKGLNMSLNMPKYLAVNATKINNTHWKWTVKE